MDAPAHFEFEEYTSGSGTIDKIDPQLLAGARASVCGEEGLCVCMSVRAWALRGGRRGKEGPPAGLTPSCWHVGVGCPSRGAKPQQTCSKQRGCSVSSPPPLTAGLHNERTTHSSPALTHLAVHHTT